MREFGEMRKHVTAETSREVLLIMQQVQQATASNLLDGCWCACLYMLLVLNICTQGRRTKGERQGRGICGMNSPWISGDPRWVFAGLQMELEG